MIDKRYKQSPSANAARCKDWHARVKKLVLDHYSGSEAKCACCGENHVIFLTLDHVDGDGAKHRKKIFAKGSGGAAIYRWCILNEFPPMFRVLCFNCNFAIHNLGECPHERT